MMLRTAIAALTPMDVRAVVIALLLVSCGPQADGSLGALCRCGDDPSCKLQVTSCAPGLRCSFMLTHPNVGGVCVPADAGS
jgi:hypothetical protein